VEFFKRIYWGFLRRFSGGLRWRIFQKIECGLEEVLVNYFAVLLVESLKDFHG